MDQFAEVNLPEKKPSVVFRQAYTNATYKSVPLLERNRALQYLRSPRDHDDLASLGDNRGVGVD